MTRLLLNCVAKEFIRIDVGPIRVRHTTTTTMSTEEEMKDDDDGKATTTTTTTMADGPGVDEVDDNAATNVNVDPAVGGLKNADDASPNETTSEAGKKEETMTTTVTPTTADSSSSKMETMEDEALPTTGGEKGSKDASAADDHRKLMMHTKSFRAPTPGSAASRELEVYIATWNVGNKAPTMEAASEWLSKARTADIVAIGAQEASYLKTKKTVKPPQVSTELGDSVVFKSKLKKRGFFKSTKWTRMGMMAGGAFAGGVMGSAPGAMCGMFTGTTRVKSLCKRSRAESTGLISSPHQWEMTW